MPDQQMRRLLKHAPELKDQQSQDGRQPAERRSKAGLRKQCSAARDKIKNNGSRGDDRQFHQRAWPSLGNKRVGDPPGEQKRECSDGAQTEKREHNRDGKIWPASRNHARG